MASFSMTFDQTTPTTSMCDQSTEPLVSTATGYLDMALTNATSAVTPLQTPNYIYVWISVVNVVIFLAGFMGNVMVIIVVFRVKNMRTPTNLCLVNLSIADVLVLCICQTSALFEFFAEERWMLGKALCHAIPFLELLSTHASVLIMMGVSFGRYYAVCRPLKSYSTCGRSRTLIMMACMWIVAAMFAVPMAIMTQTLNATFHRDGSRVQVCQTRVYLRWHYAYIIGIFGVFFVIPFFVMVFVYSRIIHTVLNESAHMKENANTQSFRRASFRNQRQIACMLFTIVLVFFVCTLPLRIIIFWKAFTDIKNIENLGLVGYLHLIWCARVLQYLHSAINPIIYSAFSSKFRRAFKYILGLKKRSYALSRPSQRTCASTQYSFVKNSKSREHKELYM